jgi:hypothetical protein
MLFLPISSRVLPSVACSTRPHTLTHVSWSPSGPPGAPSRASFFFSLALSCHPFLSWPGCVAPLFPVGSLPLAHPDLPHVSGWGCAVTDIFYICNRFLPMWLTHRRCGWGSKDLWNV